MTARTETDAAGRLEQVFEVLDANEKVMLLYTLRLFAKRKSKSTRTRCLNDFKRWIDGYRAEKAPA